MDPSLPSALSSLDDSLAQYCGSLGEISAAHPVDVAVVLGQLKAAAESAEALRSFIFSELPEASWENREQLHAVLEQIQKNIEIRRLEALRSRLLDLATELERGNIVHRRAARVSELNQLREQAIDELLAQAGADGAPQTLPGPEASQWVNWACELQEPDDTDSLKALRDGFARLDDFVTNLEPDMWVVDGVPASVKAAMSADPAAKAEEARMLEERRTRLLALALELEGGRVVHHRATRVSQLNQMRDQAITDLRSQAKPGGKPRELPGPDASQWVEWACQLQEPEDSASLESLRKGFASLDDFVANLEFEMWVGAGIKPAEVQQTPPKPPESKPPQSSKPEVKRPEPAVATATAVAATAVAATAVAAPIAAAPAPAKAPAVAAKTPAVATTVAATATAATVIAAAPAVAKAAAAAAAAPAKAPKTGKAAKAEPPAAQPVAAFEATKASPVETPAAKPEKVAESQPAANAAIAGVGGLTPDRVQNLRESMATVAREEEERESFYANFSAKAEELLGAKWRIVLGTVAVLVLVVMGAALWKLHKNNTSTNNVKAAERADVSRVAPDNKTLDPSGMTAMAATPPPASQPTPSKDAKAKDQAAAAKQPTTDTQQPAQVKSASLLDDGGLRTPTAMPKNAVKREEASAEGPGGLPGVLPNGAPSNGLLNNVVRDMPVAQPKIAPQKVKVSSGVAQGMLVHRVTPQYPTQAREKGIQGTVVLQAVIGKDGSVRSVKAVSGNSILRQAAVDAVKQWRYRPYSLDGEPVEADTEINVQFTPNE